MYGLATGHSDEERGTNKEEEEEEEEEEEDAPRICRHGFEL